MLLINLLPPELRKKRGGTDFNPIVLAVAASVVLSLVPAGTWAWMKYVRLPAARAILEEQQALLAAKTAEAAAVEKLRAQISDFKAHRDQVIGLLAQKMYWARALDEFANAIAGPWAGFEVCCTDLQIQPVGKSTGPASSARGKKDSSVTFMMKGRYKLVGEERPKSGDYVKNFFNGIELSSFWKNQGLQEKPEKTYRGDTPAWNEDVSRVTVEFNLDWQRVKTIASAPTKGAK